MMKQGVKSLLVGAAVAIASFGMFTLVSTSSDASGDMSANAVIRGGTANINVLRDKYNRDATPGAKAIFAHMGITSNMVNGAQATMGYVTKSGKVLVNGKTVATNAMTTGRQYIPGSQAQNASGTKFYTRSPSVSFRSQKIKALVFTNQYGQFTGAVLLDCGNPVKATPVPPVKVKACDTRTYTVVSITKQEMDSQKYYTNDHANCVAPCTITGKENLKATDPQCKEDPKCTIKGKESLKADDPVCKAEPKCTVDGKEDLKATDPACKEDPTCTIKGKETLKANDPACKEAPKCTIKGKETLKATDPKCKADPMCAIDGKKNLKANDAACKEDPKCTIKGKESLKATDPKCKADPMCTIKGKEKLKASDAKCKADPKCTVKGKETLKATDPKCKVDAKKIKVCDLEKDAVVEINATDFNEKDYDKDIAACGEPVKKPTPKPAKALPKAGPAENALGSIGIGMIVAAGYYLHTSRRYM